MQRGLRSASGCSAGADLIGNDRDDVGRECYSEWWIKTFERMGRKKKRKKKK